jgi:hypothetical protein
MYDNKFFTADRLLFRSESDGGFVVPPAARTGKL